MVTCVTVIPRLYYLSALISVRKLPLIFFRAFTVDQAGYTAQTMHHMHLLASASPIASDCKQPRLIHFCRLHVHMRKYSNVTVIIGITISCCDGQLCTAVQLFVAKIFKVCDTPLHTVSTDILLLMFLTHHQKKITKAQSIVVIRSILVTTCNHHCLLIKLYK